MVFKHFETSKFLRRLFQCPQEFRQAFIFIEYYLLESFELGEEEVSFDICVFVRV
ncbi:Uncharacterised protein [Sphingobacterium daejeonense]|nr:Uncharacterised protein [Sphingobacterium daejeonense]